MSYETLLFSLADGRARITSNQPEVAMAKEAGVRCDPAWTGR